MSSSVAIQELGWLTGASGLGALTSAISLTLRKSVLGLTRMIQLSTALLGGALIGFGRSHQLWLSLALMAFAGFGLMQTASASNTIIQSLVPEDKRARVISYYAMAFYGSERPTPSFSRAPAARWSRLHSLLSYRKSSRS